MNKTLLAAAFVGVLSATAGVAFASDDEDNVGRTKCYGISKAGRNDCASAMPGGHNCAKKAVADKDGDDWRYASKGECAALGGSATPATPPAAATPAK